MLQPIIEELCKHITATKASYPKVAVSLKEVFIRLTVIKKKYLFYLQKTDAEATRLREYLLNALTKLNVFFGSLVDGPSQEESIISAVNEFKASYTEFCKNLRKVDIGEFEDWTSKVIKHFVECKSSEQDDSSKRHILDAKKAPAKGKRKQDAWLLKISEEKDYGTSAAALLDASKETVYLELSRMVSAAFPKVRIGKREIDLGDKTGIRVGVASKFLPDYKALIHFSRKVIIKNLTSFKWQGFGNVVALAYVFADIDLTLQNIGVVANKWIICIDLAPTSRTPH